MPESAQFPVRAYDHNRRAIVFLHGFSGDSYKTFGMMPAFVAGDPSLSEWDIWCFGYPTHLSPDVTGIWSADPDLVSLGGHFANELESRSRYGRYAELAIVAHSMGGLIAQRALLDSPATERIRHVLMYGTPSGGLRKTKLGRIFKRQVRDMAPDSDFIRTLRADWARHFADPPFSFDAVAGLKDQFVPPSSSQRPFAEQNRKWVGGNHLEMVKPSHSDEDSVNRIRDRLTGEHPANAPADAPLAAPGEMDDAKSIVDRALALEMAGRQDDAILLLEQHVEESFDIRGALAGRYKRRWLADPDDAGEDGETALRLYTEGWEGASSTAGHAEEAAYNGINAAFMTLGLRDDRDEARTLAEAARSQTEKIDDDPWHRATLAEADLHLGDDASALRLYGEAMERLDPRQRASMVQQGIWTARLLENEPVETHLTAMLVSDS